VDNRIVELLQRNLQEVFGEGDAGRRRAAIKDFYTEDCVLYAPTGVVIGHSALDKFAGDLRATHPHFVYTTRGEPQASHNGGLWHGAQARKAKPPSTSDWMSSLCAMARSLRLARLHPFRERAERRLRRRHVQPRQHGIHHDGEEGICDILGPKVGFGTRRHFSD
jgi:hypothetical protein